MFSKKSQQGFSLLELMVVIAIFLIITAVVMADIPGIGRKGALDLTAQEVAGCVRAAQVYGTAKKIELTNTNDIIGAKVEQDKIIIFANDLSSENNIIETCELNGFNLTSEDFDIVKFPSSLYERTIQTSLEPEFYNGATPSLPSSAFEIKVTSIRTNQVKCVYIYQSGQITVGDCE
ncbi:MAG TPA: type II secretion system protein [Candidatus Paceibacterota bacterium]|nr:type II secretion system protein [Candidatus Paceibacterota bacterium]HOG37635.1 type II secretion system protein [Candidatus Woesebacteria bacterium]